MKSFRLVIMALFLVASVASNALASFIPASAGKAEQQRLRWKDRTITIAISNSIVRPNSNIKSDSDVLGAIRRSILAWQNVADLEIQYEFSDLESVSPSGVSGDGVSLLSIAQSVDNVLLFSKDPQAESAKTRVFYNGKNLITEADIVLNPFQQFSTDGTFGTFDLEATLTHEIGHLLGLRHSKVLGATMSTSLAKNGVFGLANFASRSLAASDIAAIRDLYGQDLENENCCAAFAGKLLSPSIKPGSGLRVWAEENNTGRVAAQADVSADGSFRLGGLSGGTYSVFWQRDGDVDPSSVGGLGTFKVDGGETIAINEKIAVTRTDISLSYVGVNSQLTNSAIVLNSGREYSVFLGGKNLDPKRIAIEFNSPFMTVVSNSLSKQDFGNDVSVVNFIVTIHADTPPGVYTIFATGSDGLMTSLIGALSVQ